MLYYSSRQLSRFRLQWFLLPSPDSSELSEKPVLIISILVVLIEESGWFTRLPDTDAQHSKFSRSPLRFAITDCNRKRKEKKNSSVVQTFASLRRCCCCFQQRKSFLRGDRSGNNNSRTKQHAAKRKLYFLSKLIWLEVTKPCPIQHVTITKYTDCSIGGNWSRIEINFSYRWSIWMHCRMLAQSLGVSNVTRLE